MGKPTIGQTHNVVSILTNNADWESLDSETLQLIVNNPRDAGEKFTTFLRNGTRSWINEGKLKLNFSEIVSTNIPIEMGAFPKSFFRGSGKMLFIDFDNDFLWYASDTIPTYSSSITVLEVLRSIPDRGVLEDIGQNGIFTPEEALAVLKGFISKQPNGGKGYLDSTGIGNAVCARWKYAGNELTVLAYVSWDEDIFNHGHKIWHYSTRRFGSDVSKQKYRLFVRA